MDFRRLKRLAGHYFAIAIVLGVPVLSVLATALQPETAVAATEASLAWKPTSSYSCLSPQSHTSVNVTLTYTDSSGKQYDFRCLKIQTIGQNIQQMYLVLSLNDKCANVFQVGGESTADLNKGYQSAKFGLFNNNNLSGCPSYPRPNPVSISTVYNGLPQRTVGTATWRKMDATHQTGILDASLSNPDNLPLGSLKLGDKETFTQTGLSGNIMILTGTKAGCGKNFDYIDVGVTNSYYQDTFGTLTTFVPGVDAPGTRCTPIQGTIQLVDKNGKPQSYIDAGGQPPVVPVTTDPNKCLFDVGFLNFVLCPANGLIGSTVQALSSKIQDVLYIDTNTIFSPDGSFQQAFNSFRNIALSIIVITGLVMVASQAAGLEIFSAYTIRKALPKLVFAIIGLALAWPLLQFAITFFNDLGTWTRDLILGPFTSLPNSGNINANLFDLLFGSAATTIGIVALGTAGLFSLGVVTLLALFVAFITLIIRQIVIVICILLAPLAIALSVLPGTEGLWKMWRTTITGMLTMFPIVMGFLASGEAVARVTYAQAQAAKGSGFVFGIIAIIANYLPYFFIPTALSLGNRMVGNIQGLVGKPFAGFQKGQAQFRAQRQAQNMQAFRAGSRFSEGAGATLLSLGTNRLANFVGAQAGAGLRLGGRQAAIAEARTLTADAAAKLNPHFAANMNDPNFLMEMLGVNTGDSAARAKARLVPRTRQMRAAAFDALGRSGQFTGTGADAIRIAQSIGGRNTPATRTLIRQFQENSRSAGRLDLGGDSLEAAIANMRPEDLNNMKGGAITNIFTPTGGRTEAPIAALIRTGQYVDANGGVQTLTEAQRDMLGRVLYEASAGNRVSGGSKEAVDLAYTTALGSAARPYILRGRTQSMRAKTGT